MSTVGEAVRDAAVLLSEAGVGAPSRDARRIMADVLSVDMGHLTLSMNEAFFGEAENRFQAMVARRASREPMSHILGHRDFWKSRFRVTPDVLDPRPETETLVACALEEPFSRVLDIGTGSGAILISLLIERSAAIGVGTDVSPQALLVASENAERLGVADRITLVHSHWFDDVGGRYDLIVSNPPYIAAHEMSGLEPEVRDHEPRVALTDEAAGLTGYQEIARVGAHFLAPAGRIAVEIGSMQGRAVTDLFRKADYHDIVVHSDLDGRDRVVSARKSKKMS